jgi:hypothetical protein
MTVAGRSQLLVVLRPASWFINMLVGGCQARLNKSHYLLTLFVFSRISSASPTRRTMHPDVLSTTEVPMKRMPWPVLMMCSATADFSGWFRRISLSHSLHLVSLVLTLCGTFTLLQGHGVRRTHGTFRSNLSTCMQNLVPKRAHFPLPPPPKFQEVIPSESRHQRKV